VRGAKGQGVRAFPLTELACVAWRNFIAVEAWGDKTNDDGDRFFDTGAYGKLIHKAGWPVEIKPYNARHTYARAALASGVNLGDLQALLGHASPEITRDIYGGFVTEKTREASEKMDTYLKEAFTGLRAVN
jgi:integrase